MFLNELNSIRSQRQKALSLMKYANEVRGLPKHLQWHEKILATMKAAVAKLDRKISARKQEARGVS